VAAVPSRRSTTAPAIHAPTAAARLAATQTARLRLGGLLLVAAPLVLIANFLVFGGPAYATRVDARAADPALQTLTGLSRYLSANAATWIAFNLGGLLFTTLACGGLIQIARVLRGADPAARRSTRPLALAAITSAVLSLLAWAVMTSLLLGLAAGPERLPPLVAAQPLNHGGGALVGIGYQVTSEALLAVAVTLLGAGLFTSGLLRRTGLAVALTNGLILAGALGFAALSGGAPPVVGLLLAVPLGMGLLLRKEHVGGATAHERTPYESVPHAVT
jgi:hypothetical protein